MTDVLAWVPVRGNESRGTGLGPGKAWQQVLGAALPDSLLHEGWQPVPTRGYRFLLLTFRLPLQPPAPSRSSRHSALPDRRAWSHPTAPRSLRTAAPAPTARQRPGHHIGPSCRSSAARPVSWGQSAPIFLTIRGQWSSTTHSMGAAIHPPQPLKAAPASPPDGADRDPPEQPQQLRAGGVPGSGEQGAHEAAPRCKVGPQDPRAGPEDLEAAGEHHLQLLRAEPAAPPEQQRRGP